MSLIKMATMVRPTLLPKQVMLKQSGGEMLKVVLNKNLKSFIHLLVFQRKQEGEQEREKERSAPVVQESWHYLCGRWCCQSLHTT